MVNDNFITITYVGMVISTIYAVYSGVKLLQKLIVPYAQFLILLWICIAYEFIKLFIESNL